MLWEIPLGAKAITRAMTKVMILVMMTAPKLEVLSSEELWQDYLDYMKVAFLYKKIKGSQVKKREQELLVKEALLVDDENDEEKDKNFINGSYADKDKHDLPE